MSSITVTPRRALLRDVMGSPEFEQSTNVGMLYQGLDGTFLDVNRRASELLGLAREELVGLTGLPMLWDATHFDGTPFVNDERPSLDSLATGQPHSDVIMGIVTRTNTRRWLSVSTCALHDDSGRVVGVLSSFVDATWRVRHERLLNILNDITQYATGAHSEPDFLDYVCSTLTTRSGYPLVWIGGASAQDPFGVDILHQAGESAGYLYPGIVSSDPDDELGRGPTGVTMRTRVTTTFNGVTDKDAVEPWSQRMYEHHLASVAVLPISLPGPGVLCVYDGHTIGFDEDVISDLTNVVRAVEFGLAHVRDRESITRALAGTLGVIAGLTETRDPYTEGHQIAVGGLAGAIARQLGLDDALATLIAQAGEVHDVGKIAVPAEILTRPGRLTTLEFEMIKTHTTIGAGLLERAGLPWPIAEVALTHHERLDGSGYPLGLVDEEIILPARIVAVADVVEAMVHHRPYRHALGLDAARAEITSKAGTQLDADVVAACLAVLDNGFHFPTA